MSKNQQKFYDFRYGCDENEIDLRTLLYSQECYLGLLLEINRSLFPNQNLSIKIKAIEPGSFVVSQIVEISVIVGNVIFSIGPISDLFRAIEALFKIREVMARHNGEKPKERQIEQNLNIDNKTLFVDNLNISFQNGDTFNVNEGIFNFYKTNTRADDYATKMSEVILNDQRVRNIQIIDKESSETLWSADKNRFEAAQAQNPYMLPSELETIHEEEEECVITVIKLDLSAGESWKWDVIKEGKSLKNIEMLDTAFKTKVKNKEIRFGYNDEMRVRMRVTFVWNDRRYCYEPKKREILEVLEFPFVTEKQTEIQFDADK